MIYLHMAGHVTVLKGTKDRVSVDEEEVPEEEGPPTQILTHGDLDAEAVEGSHPGLSPEAGEHEAPSKVHSQEEAVEGPRPRQGRQMNRRRRSQSRGHGTDLVELGVEIKNATALALGFTIGPNGERNWSYKNVDYHVLLEAGGYLPVVGAIFDGARVVAYVIEGDFENAAIAAVEAVPIVGDTLGAGRKIVKVAQKAEQATGGVGGKVVTKGKEVAKVGASTPRSRRAQNKEDRENTNSRGGSDADETVLIKGVKQQDYPYAKNATDYQIGGTFKQCFGDTCVSAVGQLLTDNKFTEEQLFNELGEWSNFEYLASTLNKIEGASVWKNKYVDIGEVVDFARKTQN